jgi:hypothetical protein
VRDRERGRGQARDGEALRLGVGLGKLEQECVVRALGEPALFVQQRQDAQLLRRAEQVGRRAPLGW